MLPNNNSDNSDNSDNSANSAKCNMTGGGCPAKLGMLPDFASMLNKKPKTNMTEILNSDKLKFEDMVKYLQENKLYDNTTFSNENVYQDLEVYRGLDDATTSLLSKVNKTSTVFGYLKLVNILNKSTNDVEVLNKRQHSVKQMKTLIEEGNTDIETKLTELKGLERDVLWLLRPKTTEEQSILNGVYFNGRFFNNFNQYEEPLNVYSYFKIYLSPLYGLLSPLVMMVFPYLYLKFFSKVKLDFAMYVKILKMSLFGSPLSFLGGSSAPRSKISKYFSFFLSIIFYIQNLMNSISVSVNTNKIIQ